MMDDIEVWARAVLSSGFCDEETGDVDGYGAFTALYLFPSTREELEAELDQLVDPDLLIDRSALLDDGTTALSRHLGGAALVRIDDQGFVGVTLGSVDSLRRRFRQYDHRYTTWLEETA